MLNVTGQDDYRPRIVPAIGACAATSEVAEKGISRRRRSSDKLKLGAVKLMTDGSIQGWTACVRWPGYIGRQPNGLWNAALDEIFEFTEEMQRQGVQMHIHVNGDEAAELSLDALENAGRRHLWLGARHILQHCQMMDQALFRRTTELGVACIIFANHLWFFGDQHAELPIGTDCAARMDAVRTALDEGVCCAIHSDAPVTLPGPIITAWCAVNRRAMSGRILGVAEFIPVTEVLKPITLGAATTLKLDGEIDRITPGKRADFAVEPEIPAHSGNRLWRSSEPDMKPLPLSVIGGYLCAGRTTLINGLLVGKHGLHLTVLVNDSGRSISTRRSCDQLAKTPLS